MRLAWLALLACEMVFAASTAHADARFGDSTWVAPSASIDGVTRNDGPPRAPRDGERGWETALRAPFRVVFFPLRLLGNGLEAGANLVGTRFLEPKPKGPPKPGAVWGPNFSLGSVTDIGVGPALTWTGFPTADATLRLAGSWSTLDRRRVRLSQVFGEEHPVGFRLRADYEYRPNRHYYGIGNNTPATDLSYFLLESSNAEAALLLGASSLRQLRILTGFSSLSPGRGYHGQPLLEDVFTPITAPYEHQSAQNLWYGLAADLGTLDDRRDPSRGVHARAELRQASGLRSSDPDYFQWRVEGRAYLPVFAKRRVIAVRGVYTGVEPSNEATTALPYYLLAQTERSTRFAGFASGRFRDRQLMLARIEYRWAIIYRVSAIGLYELGEVAPRAGSFNLRDAHTAYGGGVRLGLSDETALRFELAKSVEGLQATLAVGSDF